MSCSGAEYMTSDIFLTILPRIPVRLSACVVGWWFSWPVIFAHLFVCYLLFATHSAFLLSYGEYALKQVIHVCVCVCAVHLSVLHDLIFFLILNACSGYGERTLVESLIIIACMYPVNSDLIIRRMHARTAILYMCILYSLSLSHTHTHKHTFIYIYCNTAVGQDR